MHNKAGKSENFADYGRRRSLGGVDERSFDVGSSAFLLTGFLTRIKSAKSSSVKFPRHPKGYFDYSFESF
jgi:hypothetical protein